MEDSREFVAYGRKLLRVLLRIRKALTAGNTEEARIILDELISDTEKDIEA